jgi:cyanamide hydratase
MTSPADYGFFPVPRNIEQLLKGRGYLHKPNPVDVATAVTLPAVPIVQAVWEFAKSKLPPETFNHCNRVFYYGASQHFHCQSWLTTSGAVIIAQQFPEHANNSTILETYTLTCLLHDIATADEFLYATRMSFDFYGAFLAREFLLNRSAPQDEADAVAEAILRHQDVEVNGTITFIGLIIQLTTLLGNLSYLHSHRQLFKTYVLTNTDNAGSFLTLISPETIDSVVKLYPRLNWSSCFSKFAATEISVKPWCHSTAVTDFVKVVKENKYFIDRYESNWWCTTILGMTKTWIVVLDDLYLLCVDDINENILV